MPGKRSRVKKFTAKQKRLFFAAARPGKKGAGVRKRKGIGLKVAKKVTREIKANAHRRKSKKR